jgi:two-component system cell cycle sensor histidine kinase/response regulator CckA
MQGLARARRVLVVDDDPSVRRGLVRMLQFERWDAQDAPNVTEALTSVDSWTPDVVLTDLRMPGMDGVALIEALRLRLPGVPVVVMTASTDIASAGRAMRAGAVDYLTKPIELTEVLKALESAAGRTWPDLDPEALRLTREIGPALADPRLDVEATLEIVTRLSSEALGDLVFARLAREGGLLLPAAFHHPLPEARALVDRALRHSWPVEEGPLARALAPWAPIVVQLSGEEVQGFCSAKGLSAYAARFGASSMLLAALRGRGSTLGILGWVRGPSRRPYGERELSLLETIAGRASFAVEAGLLAARLADQQRQTERAEESLRHSQEQLGQSQRMDALGRLAGGAAHDFNNVLSVVLGYADLLLEDDDLSDAARAKAQGILKAAQHGAALTRQLLAYGRQQMLEPRIVDLNETVEGLADMLRRIVGTGIEVRLELSTDLGRVKLDPTQIQQVLINLAINARDAMSGGGALTVRTANAPPREDAGDGARPWAMLSVTDTGVGMDTETQARIFEPFFTTKGPGKGTGLGLATVQGIVEQSGGRIEVDTTPGGGATFRVYFPHSREGASRKSSKPKLAASRGGETILLMEQDDDVRTLLARFLGRGGYRVLTAASAAEARACSQGEPGTIALLLAGSVASGPVGLDLPDELLRARPEMRVLYLAPRAPGAARGSPSEEASFLPKPVARDVLLAKVRTVLDGAA